MVREGLSAGARQLCLSLAPLGSNQMGFCFRTNQSATATVSNTPAPSGPVWLRLVRLGNAFSGYYSTNRNTWVPFGSATIPMTTAVQAGLAVVSGSSSSPALAALEGVLVEPAERALRRMAAVDACLRGVTNPSLTAPEADPDADGRSNWAEYKLGSDPLVADAARAVTVAGLVNGSAIILRFTERKNADELGRRFYFSTNLAEWTAVTPASNTLLQDLGSVVVREVTFPTSTVSGFYRAAYGP